MAEAASKSGRTFRMPHTLVIVGSLVVFVLVLAWLVPSGADQTVEKAGRTVTVPGTYQQVEKVWLGPQWVVVAPIRGFDEPGNFTHAFKRWAGLTPSAYRAAKAP